MHGQDHRRHSDKICSLTMVGSWGIFIRYVQRCEWRGGLKWIPFDTKNFGKRLIRSCQNVLAGTPTPKNSWSQTERTLDPRRLSLYRLPLPLSTEIPGNSFRQSITLRMSIIELYSRPSQSK